MSPDQRCSKCSRTIPSGTPDGQCPYCFPEFGAQEPDQSGDPIERYRNLLFAVLAVQMRLISNEDFVEATDAWSADPTSVLSERLVNSGATTGEEKDFIEKLVAQWIDHFGGDAMRAFDRLGGHAEVAEQLTLVESEEGDELADRLGIRLDVDDVLDDVSVVDESPGRYSRGSEYSRGGMGRILLVHDAFLSRDVALKELLPRPDSSREKLAGDTPMKATSDMVVRFLREARVTGQLEHPAIVPVYEMGRRANGSLYYTMKLVRGQTLGKALQRTKSNAERLSFLSHYLDLCQALAYAHSRNVVHRDIKPSNVMIGEFGETVVIDWGLAKVLGRTDEDEAEIAETWSRLKEGSSIDPGHTTPGMLVGTPQYMAPEQAEGRVGDIDQRTDVFSLGVMLYELLTGKRPFEGTSSREVLLNVIAADPRPVTETVPSVPPELASICARAMHRDPKQRYESAKDLADDVQRFLTGAVVRAYEYSPIELARRMYARNRGVANTALAASALLLVLGVVSYINIMRSRNEAVVARDDAIEAREQADTDREQAQVANYINQIRLAQSYLQENNYDRARQVLWATEPVRRHWEWGYLVNKAYRELYTIDGQSGFAFSHDGEAIACFYRTEQIGIYNASDGVLIAELDPESGGFLAQLEFSPDDSRLLALSDQGHLNTWDTETWQPLASADPHDGKTNGAGFLPNGSVLTTGNDGTVRTWNAGLTTELSSLDALDNDVRLEGLSSDGSRALAVVGEQNVQVWDIANGESLCVLEREQPPRYARLSQNGQLVAIADDDLVEIWDVNDSQLRHTLDGKHAAITWLGFDSGGGRLLVTGSEGQAIIWNTETGLEAKRISTGLNLMHANWSPDDSLFCTMPYQGSPQVWDASSATQGLVNELGEHTRPAPLSSFFPDSTRYLTSSFDRTIKAWSAQANSGQQIVARTATDLKAIEVNADFDQLAVLDQHRVLSVIDLTRNRSLVEIRSTEDLEFTSMRAAISPDGRFVVATLDPTVPMVVDLATGELANEYYGHHSPVQSLAVSQSSRLVASAAWEGTVHVWSPDSAQSSFVIELDEKPTELSADPSGELLAVGDAAGGLRLFDFTSGELVERLDDQSESVSGLAWSDDGRMMASGSVDGRVNVWQRVDGLFHRRHVLNGHTASARAIAFTVDGSRLLTASIENLRVWDVALGKELVVLNGPTEGVTDLARLTEGNALLTSHGRTLRRWTPAPWDQFQTIDDQEEAFAEYRRSRSTTLPLLYPIGKHNSPLTIVSSLTMQRCLDELAAAIGDDNNNDDSTQEDFSDGLAIIDGATGRAVASIGLRLGDRIKAIDSRPIVDVASSVEAISASRDAIATGNRPISMEILRGDDRRLVRFQILPSQFQTTSVSISRQEAIEMLTRVREGFRRATQSDTPRAGGVRMRNGATSEDRDRYLKSLLAPEDIVLRINDAPVDTVAQFRSLIGDLLPTLQSSQTSSFSLDIQRGELRQMHITYDIR